jgi:hypothetical protein
MGIARDAINIAALAGRLVSESSLQLLKPLANRHAPVRRNRIRGTECSILYDWHLIIGTAAWKENWVRFAKTGELVVLRFQLRDAFLRRTPGPPPFSSMNSTPALSSARRIA